VSYCKAGVLARDLAVNGRQRLTVSSQSLLLIVPSANAADTAGKAQRREGDRAREERSEKEKDQLCFVLRPHFARRELVRTGSSSDSEEGEGCKRRHPNAAN
jgi:hypothetical protein